MRQQEKLAAIEEYVLAERLRRGLKNIDTSTKTEVSGESAGEFVLLLERQLMTTVAGFGGWLELSDVNVLNGVYEVVRERTGNVG